MKKKIYKPFVPLLPVVQKGFLKVDEPFIYQNEYIDSLMHINDKEFLAINYSESRKHLTHVLSHNNIIYLFGSYKPTPLQIKINSLSINLLKLFALIEMHQLPIWDRTINNKYDDIYVICINKCDNRVFRIHIDVFLGYKNNCNVDYGFANTYKQKVTVKNGVIIDVKNLEQDIETARKKVQNLKNKIMKFNEQKYDILKD